MKSEIQIQAECFQWLWNYHPLTRKLFFHVPNGGHRNVVEATQLKASGVIPGIPDCIFIQPMTGKAYGFEFKTSTGRLSAAQIGVHRVWEGNNVKVFITRSLEEFKEQILPLIAHLYRVAQPIHTDAHTDTRPAHTGAAPTPVNAILEEGGFQ